MYLLLNDIAHRRTRVKSPQTNGFVERFHRTLGEEFFAPTLRKTLYEELPPLQEDLDEWLRFYNHERPHLGYRNQGRCPLQTFRQALEKLQREHPDKLTHKRQNQSTKKEKIAPQK